LLSVAEKVGIDPVLSDDDDDDEIDERDIDQEGNMKAAQAMNPLQQEPKSLKDLKVTTRAVPMVKPDIKEQLDQLDVSKVKESILQKKQPKAPSSLLGKQGE